MREHGLSTIMYAIFEDGSRQYRVEPGSIVVVDYRAIEPGQTLEFDRVLLISGGAETQIGQPLVAGAKIVTEVVDLPKKKTVIQHLRRRKNYRRLKGHTQPYVRAKVKDIVKG
jgi:large subunit ribosomal protein L21